jgi:hypothetical protein
MTMRDDGLAARALQNDEFGKMILVARELAPSPQKPLTSKTSAQSSSAFTDLGDNRKLRRLRLTLLR